jgi:outer membrane immunogenic protein
MTPKPASSDILVFHPGTWRHVTSLPQPSEIQEIHCYFSGGCFAVGPGMLRFGVYQWRLPMRRLSIGVVAAVSTIAFSQVAAAADLPRKAPALAPPLAIGWTGWYVGLNTGATWNGHNDINVVSSPAFNAPGLVPDIMVQGAAGATAKLSNGNGNNGGFIGGAQIGYNYQFASSWVAGIEADIQGILGSKSNLTANTAVQANNGIPITTHIDASKQIDWLGTVRGRLGWRVTPSMLLYGTGGLAYGGVKSSVSISQVHLSADTFGSTAASVAKTRTGWTAGAGFEWIFMPRLSVKLEYLYYDLGDESYNAGLLQAAFTNGFVRYAVSPQVSTRFDGHIARVGVNYHF